MLFSAVVLATGCGPSGAGDPGDEETVLILTPGDAEIVVRDGQAATQSYTAIARDPDGGETDVTAETVFSVDDTRLGGFTGALFTAPGASGGATTVRGLHDGIAGQAALVVRVEGSRVDPSAPADAPDLFDGASEDAARAPTLVYPADRSLVPPNLGDLEAHWTDAAGNDLFEVRLVGDHVDLRVYAAGTATAAGRWAAFLPAEWAVAGESERGGSLTLTVRGLATASPEVAGTSAPVQIALADQDIDGGLYYWAAAGALPAGIYRHDLARPGQPAESYYTTSESPGNRCVACHVLSRDGTRMAITLDGGDGAATILDVATRTPMMPVDGSYRWNFAAFNPDASRIITVHQGRMVLRDTATGGEIAELPTGTRGTQPDFSPDGTRVAFIAAPGAAYDWVFSGGSLMVMTYDRATDTFGAPTPLVPSAGGSDNVYYPSWSPDGQWIVFNRSSEDAYDDPSAEVFVVRADGTAPPQKLDTPNVSGGITNSWARWAPFEQVLGDEPIFWLTFSSKRAFGVRLPGGQPQLWMAPFLPARAAGGDPSGPAFRLPFQDIATSNHIAQWTERVVEVE
ncbi:MAG TPA: hypothetical protein VFU21_20890 [Kofleriaceae bacterium]|nr:hypothetical protein [Kofleriaceae bacterium]